MPSPTIAAEIIRLPGAVRFLQPLLATAISTLRAPKSSEGYKAIGGGSPLRKITEDQADALATALRAKGMQANVYVGMRYWHPYTEEALEQIKKDGVTQLVILPLYPQFSISTSGSSLRLLEQVGGKLRAFVMHGWGAPAKRVDGRGSSGGVPHPDNPTPLARPQAHLGIP